MSTAFDGNQNCSGPASSEPAYRTFLSWAAFPGTMAAAFAAYFWLKGMGVPVWLSPYPAAVLAAALVTLMEFVIPCDRSWVPCWNDVKHDLLFMIAIQALLPLGLAWFFSVTLIQYLSTLGLEVTRFWPHRLPVAAQLALMLVAQEFFRYWLHYAAHNTKVLWSLHAVHHSPKKLYWLNVGRFHPGDKALQYILETLPFVVAGVGVEVLASYLVFYAVLGFYQHSNVDARYGVLNYILSSGELHRWHHSRRIKESNTNYGNKLIVWDLVFGTWFLPKDRRVGDLGLLNRSYPMGFFQQMTTPLVPGLDKRSGAANAS